MRTTLAMLLWVVGAGIMIYGIGSALMELISLYQGALSDPLKETAVTEQTVSKGMIHNLLVGAAGIPFLIVGSLMLRVAMVRSIRRRLEARRDA